MSSGLYGLIDTTRLPSNGPALTFGKLVSYIGTLRPVEGVLSAAQLMGMLSCSLGQTSRATAQYAKRTSLT
eukprot:SAG31_NODE_28233_length_413_cov_1.111465_1_plen_70_part_10